jgi:hypothetical protein
MKILNGALLAAGVAACALATPASAQDALSARSRYSHVLLISVDGLHAVDLANWTASHPGGALASLAQHGVVYPNAYTTAPSDSFPGMIAQVTGGTPYSAGVFYDDSYDRTLFAPGSACQGQPGTETQYAENIDKDKNLLNGGGTLGQPLTQIDPAQLPLSNASGQCLPVYPHQFIRVNTLFEVVRAHGGHTAWSDKHPAYDILNGPSGQGIADLFTPEINSLIPVAGNTTDDNTTSFTATRDYDEVKVRAILNEIDGRDSTGSRRAPVPAVFGMNFQAVSVGQKLAKSGLLDPAGLVGGYTDANATPGKALTLQLAYVDGALRRMIAELQRRSLLDFTLVIVSAKHGQSPIDRSLRVAVSDTPFTLTPGYAFHVADDVGLVWLQPQTRAANLAAADAYLQSQAGTLDIAGLAGPDLLRLIYQDPATDSRTPDFIAIPQHGVIYTTGSKLAEHGGFAQDDRNVALVVSAPRIQGRVVQDVVETRQIAPTILRVLGLNPAELEAVRIEGTRALPDALR